RNFSLAQYYHVFVDDRDPYYVCGGLQDNGNWCGPSRTKEPRGIMPGEWYTVSGGDGFYTVPVPGQPNLVYSNAQGGYFRITDTNSGQTRSIEPHPWMVGSQGQAMALARYRFNWDAPIHVSPHDPGTVYWGGNVLFRSDDYGYSWDVISPDLTTDDPEKQADSGGEIYNDNTAAEFHTTILTIAESSVEAGVIWVGTDDGNVQITRDGGASWTNVRDRVPGLPAETWIGNIEASPSESGTAFVAVDNHRLDDFTPHLYETTDYGQTWRDISGGLPQDDYVKVVRQHPENANLLFVGMDRGLYASWDRGATWVDIRGNLPRVSVRGIRIQPQYNDLVIGTHGRGAWILDDIQPLVELAEAVESNVHLFGVRTATDWERWSRGSSLGQSAFTGQNPARGAWIHYYLSESAAEAVEGQGEEDGGVTVRITEASGTLVREFTDGEASAGLNRAVWNLQWTGAEPIPGQQQGGGGFGFFGGGGGGVTAVPGTYTATIVVNGEEHSTDFDVRGDPNVAASRADYEARFTAAMRARDLQSRLNQMIGTIVDLDGQVDGLLESISGKDLANESQIRETAGEAKDALTALGGEVRRPPGSMGYRDWPRLIEQLRFVARNIRGPQARPTEGQLEVLTEVEVAAAERAEELGAIING
ncbi:MAG: WD40/YVTN/BNR-like repeat-containing protein, partial [Gemmatimonadota bacterium]